MLYINNMKMADALFKKSCIKVETAFFGLKKKVLYTLTNSPVMSLDLEYDPINGQKVKDLVTLPQDDFLECLKRDGCPKTTDNGHYRLSLCFSQDHQFAALLLSRFFVFEYHAIGEVRFAEGAEAEILLKPFLKS